MKSKREELGQIVIRPTEGMRDRIKAAAEANNRSMNAEIVATLEEKYPQLEISDTERALYLAHRIYDVSFELLEAKPSEVEGIRYELNYLKDELSKMGKASQLKWTPQSLDELAHSNARYFIDLCHPDSPMNTRSGVNWRLNNAIEQANDQWGRPAGEKMLIEKLEQVTGYKYRPLPKKRKPRDES